MSDAGVVRLDQVSLGVLVHAVPRDAAEFGYAGSGDNRSAFPKASVVALAECGTHAFVAAEVDAYRVGEQTLARGLHPRLRADELLTADRGLCAWPAPGRPGTKASGPSSPPQTTSNHSTS